MTREEQNRIWSELSKESKERINNEYKTSMDDSYLKRSMNYLFGEHNFHSFLTYDDVAKNLFKDGAWQPHEYTSNYYLDENATPTYILNCTSQKQSEKLVAINKLLNVAKYLNKNEDDSDWVPDFDDEFNEFYTLGIDPTDLSVNVIKVNIQRISTEIIYFRTVQFANQAIQILGEKIIRTALTTDY